MADPRRFRDRREAGRALAERLSDLAASAPVIVALPRGGVPVGYEVARRLGAPLDIGLVRKVGAPMQRELGVGAIAEGGKAVFDTGTLRRLGIGADELREVIADEQRELERRRSSYRADHPQVDVSGRVAIVVDDGLATGLTAIAAARALRDRGAERVILAVPVCPSSVAPRLESEFDGFVCLLSPRTFAGVGGGYIDFTPTSDREVRNLLAASREVGAGKGGPTGSAEAAGAAIESVEIDTQEGVALIGTLTVPEDVRGVVLFAHGSGSSRMSPRNRAVAARLNDAGFATLLFDLLTDEESAARANVFDIDLLAHRLVDATHWAARVDGLQSLPIGYFGASTGAAAAIKAAAFWGSSIAAIVSRGGRPDLAADALRAVTAPTLLIVGGDDREVLVLNRRAAAGLGGPSRVAVVPHAGHLFEEPGALEQVADLAVEWFSAHLRSGAAHTAGAAGARS